MARFAAIRFSSLISIDEKPESPPTDWPPESDDAGLLDDFFLLPDKPITTPTAIDIPRDFKGLSLIV